MQTVCATSARLFDAHQLARFEPAFESRDEVVDARCRRALAVLLRNQLVGVVAQHPEFLGGLGGGDFVAQALRGRAVAILHALKQGVANDLNVFQAGRLARGRARAERPPDDAGDGGNQAGLRATWWGAGTGGAAAGLARRGQRKLVIVSEPWVRVWGRPPSATVTVFTDVWSRSPADARLRKQPPPPSWTGSGCAGLRSWAGANAGCRETASAPLRAGPAFPSRTPASRRAGSGCRTRCGSCGWCRQTGAAGRVVRIRERWPSRNAGGPVRTRGSRVPRAASACRPSKSPGARSGAVCNPCWR